MEIVNQSITMIKEQSMSAIVQQDFPSLTKQSRGITYIYKMVGIYSIPLLTIVTILSMSNVFTSGQFARWPYVQTIWAVIFASAIDVNIVRLFIESYVDKSRDAFWIGLCLGCVTGAALLIEGLQQSIGLTWTSWYVQFTIAMLVFARVVCVIILMAREGKKLGQMLQVPVSTSFPGTMPMEPGEQPNEPVIEVTQHEQVEQPEEEKEMEQKECPESAHVPEPEIPTNIRSIAPRRHVTKKRNKVNTLEQRIRKLAGEQVAPSDIAKQLKVSRTTVYRYLGEQQQAHA
jgi:Helix-turn-helix domain of resolvase